MSMMDKIDNLLSSLEDPEVFNEFIDDYHKFVDEDINRTWTEVLSINSFEIVDDVIYEKIASINQSFESLNIMLNEHLCIVEDDTSTITKNEEFEKEYTSENIVNFKMEVSADRKNLKILSDAA